jgi:uncharacterized membrane protein YbhN (UPF0104 family)
VLPARIGDAARAALVGRREDVPTAAALGSVVLERIIDTLILAVLVFPATIVARAPGGVVGAAGVAAVLAAAVLLFAQTPIPVGVVEIAQRRAGWSPAIALLNHAAIFLAALKAKGRLFTIAAAIGLTLGIWALEATVYWLTGRSLAIGLSPAAALLVAAGAVLGTAVPSSPGYVGTFELAATSLARAFGVDQSAALAFAILVHAITTLPLAVGGVVSLLWLGIRPRELRLRSEGKTDPEPPETAAIR